MPRGAHDFAAAGKHRVGRGQIERRDQPGAERQRRHVGQIRRARRRRRACSTVRDADLLLQIRGGGVVRFDQRRAQRQRVRRLAFARCAASIPDRPARDTLSQVRQHRDRRIAVRERRRIHERLERRARLAPAARRAVERARAVVAAADHREDVAGRRIDRDERRLRARAGSDARRPAATARSAASCSVRHERRVHLPVRRMVAAELIAELLPQVFLRPAGARVARLPVRLDARARARAPRLPAPRVMKPCSRIAREHDVAALERAVVVRPRRQRRRRADQAGDQRRLRQRQRRCAGLPEQVLATSSRRRRRRRSGRRDSDRARGSASWSAAASISSAMPASFALRP